MAKRSAQAERPRKKAIVRPPVENPLHVWLLGAVAALYVARPLVPDKPDGLGNGLLPVMLWLVLLAMWAIGQLHRGRLGLRLAPTDLAVAALFAWHTLSALWAAEHA